MKMWNLVCSGAVTGGVAALLVACASGMSGQPTTFFITSSNPGKGGDLGGLAGADAYCEKLASAAGIGGRNWRAYLSTQGPGAVNARDRIGKGPWTNAKGVVIANNLDELHNPATNKISKETGLTETGQMVNATGDSPNMHDILTGSTPDGRAFPAGRDMTCNNWTSSDQGAGMAGHHNRTGTNPDPVANASWNSSHPGPGCSMAAFQRVGGAGLFYCFAAQ